MIFPQSSQRNRAGRYQSIGRRIVAVQTFSVEGHARTCAHRDSLRIVTALAGPPRELRSSTRGFSCETTQARRVVPPYTRKDLTPRRFITFASRRSATSSLDESRSALETRLLENSRTRDGSLTRDASLTHDTSLSRAALLRDASRPRSRRRPRKGKVRQRLIRTTLDRFGTTLDRGPSTVGSERRPRFADLI